MMWEAQSVADDAVTRFDDCFKQQRRAVGGVDLSARAADRNSTSEAGGTICCKNDDQVQEDRSARQEALIYHLTASA